MAAGRLLAVARSQSCRQDALRHDFDQIQFIMRVKMSLSALDQSLGAARALRTLLVPRPTASLGDARCLECRALTGLACFPHVGFARLGMHGG